MSQPAVENGVYNIKAYSGACLEFTSNQANLTLWNCDTSFEQQVSDQIRVRFIVEWLTLMLLPQVGSAGNERGSILNPKCRVQHIH